jgi:hypothetical protein
MFAPFSYPEVKPLQLISWGVDYLMTTIRLVAVKSSVSN